MAIMGDLAHGYGETPSWSGLSNTGALMLITSNPETGTWSRLALGPNGIACVMDVGEGARVLEVDEGTGA